MKYLSLFSGIGGFELGIQQAYESNNEHAHKCEKSEQKECTQGRERSSNKHEVQLHSGDRTAPLCIGYSEIDKYAIQVYNKHFKHKNYGDITKINPETLEDFDLICGGFPCQSFSIAGKRGGFSDTRGTLFFEIARIIKEKLPRLVLLENVKGLLSHDQGRTFRIIISTLDELGYDCQWQVLNSKNFGVPQNRERVFIIGHLRGTSRPQVFPIGEKTETTDGAIFIDESQWRRENKLREYKGISPTLNTNGGGGHLPLTGISNSSKREFKWQEKRSPALCARDYKDPKIVSNNYQIRKLTPKECERLQGFPDDWTKEGLDMQRGYLEISDTQRYKMAGNAVTVNVVKEIIKKLSTG